MTAIVVYFLVGAMFIWDGVRKAREGHREGYIWLAVGTVIMVLVLRMYYYGIG